MKVLWLEITTPARYRQTGTVIGGWQDSLEEIVRQSPQVELTVAFVSETPAEPRLVDGVSYIPIHVRHNLWDEFFGRRWTQFVDRTVPQLKRIVEQVNPSVIHIFGTEWPLGQIARHTDIPVVIHIQGAIIPYSNAAYPPGYGFWDVVREHLASPHRLYLSLRERGNRREWAEWEWRTWQQVGNYMGRTAWDYAVSGLLHPGRRYFRVEEALRPVFLSGRYAWGGPSAEPLKLLTTGITTFWKGPDMLLKTARLLTRQGVNFQWRVAGYLPDHIRRMVERHEGTTFEANHVEVMGFLQADELARLLADSTMLVHTAYIENSPNGICEAQAMGVPVVSTNVGGIASLVRDGVDGVLVPANDPWQMAWQIMRLSEDKERMLSMSASSRQFALERHHPEHILQQLLDCYQTIIS